MAALFQSDISAIVVTDDSGIKRPKDLDGKSYASYGARYEDLIVKILTTPQLRASLVTMNKMLKGQDKKDESIKEKLYRELKRFK